MKFFREKKDGTKALSYTSLALIGLGCVIGLFIAKLAFSGKQDAFFGTQKASTHPKDLSDITRPASAIEQVESPEQKKTREQISARGLTANADNSGQTPQNSTNKTADDSILSGVFGTDNTATTTGNQTGGSGSDGIDSVNIALRTAEQPNKGGPENATGKPMLHEGGLSSSSDNGGSSLELYTSGATHPRSQNNSAVANSTSSGGPETGTYFDFRTNETAEKEKAKSSQEAQSHAVSRLKPIIHGLPPATVIPVYVITKIETSKEALSSPVEFAVAAPITFNHRYQLPWGTHLLGRVTNSFRNRIAFEVTNILYPDGRIIPMNGEVLGEDFALGVPAYYHAAPLMAQAAPYVADFMTAYIQYVEQQQQTPVSLSVGGTSVTTGTTQNDPRTAAMNSASQLLAQITNDQVKIITDLNAPYLFLQPYTLCYVKLIDGLDLSQIYGIDPDPIPSMRPVQGSVPAEARETGGNNDIVGNQNATGGAGNNQPTAATVTAQQPVVQAQATPSTTSDFFGNK